MIEKNKRRNEPQESSALYKVGEIRERIITLRDGVFKQVVEVLEVGEDYVKLHPISYTKVF